jgi:hypothetical protein
VSFEAAAPRLDRRHLRRAETIEQVVDVVQEWAQRHGQSCGLVLTRPAGGEWSWGSVGARIEVDAVQFCRALCGRGSADGLLAVEVPF